MTREGAGLAQSGQWLCDAVTGTGADAPCPPGTETLIGPLWASIFADGLLVLLAIVIGILVARRPDRQTILVGLAVLAIAFFVVPTRVHERYMFPFFAVGGDPRGRVLALARRVPRARRRRLRQHVRGPDHDLPEQPADPRLAGHRAGIAQLPRRRARSPRSHTVGLGWGLLQWRRASREALEDEIADAARSRAGAADPAPRARPAPVAASGDLAGAWMPAAASAPAAVGAIALGRRPPSPGPDPGRRIRARGVHGPRR